MNEGLERVRAVVGSEAESGLEDSTIKDALWNEFFDVDHAVSWLLGLSDYYQLLVLRSHISAEERDRRHAAMERRGKLLFIVALAFFFVPFFCYRCVMKPIQCLATSLHVNGGSKRDTPDISLSSSFATFTVRRIMKEIKCS